MDGDKRDFLFRFVNPSLRYEIQVDDEAIYSTTDQMTARKICDMIVHYVGKHVTVVDATACIGGLTYSLAMIFNKVIAIEIDPQRYSYLCNNMKLLQVSDRVQCVEGDALKVCNNLEATVIVLDPPWGGPEYKNNALVHLTMNDMNISEVCMFLFKNNPLVTMIALKVPLNFDDETFKKCIEIEGYAVMQKAKLRKMYLVIITRACILSK
jgi:predicted RNA methylase